MIASTMDSEKAVDEYRFLASFGTSHERIAKRLGYTPSALESLVRRAGITPKPWGPDLECAQVLDDLITAGVQFTSGSIPLGRTQGTVPRLLQRARSDGRIDKVGVNSAGATLWQAVTA